MSFLIETAYYETSAGDRIRIAVNYGNMWRPIFWFEVSKDGSVYLGPRLTSISELRQGSKPVGHESTTIKYSEGEIVKDSAILKSSKVSFHASGAINSAGDRLFRDSLRKLTQQQELCLALFRHPQNYSSIAKEKIRKRDVCLNYHLDENRPIQGLLFIAPKNNMRLVQVQPSTYQVNLIFPFSGLQGCQDLILQLVLSHGAKGAWPPYTYTLFKTKGVQEREL